MYSRKEVEDIASNESYPVNWQKPLDHKWQAFIEQGRDKLKNRA
jgi:hypothetical protein